MTVTTATTDTDFKKPDNMCEWCDNPDRYNMQPAPYATALQRLVVDYYGFGALKKHTQEAIESVAPRNSVEEMLLYQMVVANELVLNMISKSNHFLSSVSCWQTQGRQQVSSIEAARLASSGARLMDSCSKAALALDKLKNGGKHTLVVQHVEVKDGGQAIVAGGVHTATRETSQGECHAGK